MNGFVKKLGYLALVASTFALILGSTGCSGHGTWQRPGWIISR